MPSNFGVGREAAHYLLTTNSPKYIEWGVHGNSSRIYGSFGSRLNTLETLLGALCRARVATLMG